MTSAGFPGFPPQTLRFLRALSRNNTREWFEANKETYLKYVKAPMEALTLAVSRELAVFAPAYATEPKRAVYRIYRDTRFSADKTPYKTHIAANFFRADLGKNDAAGFYFHVSPKEVAVAGGLYTASPEQLLAVRTYLQEHHATLRRLLGNRSLQGETLTRAPKGFPVDHPAADLLRGKQWYFYDELDPKLAETPRLLPELVERFQAMQPVIEFFNLPLEGLARKNRRLRMDDAY